MFSNLFSGEQKTGWKKTWGSRAKWGTVMGHNNNIPQTDIGLTQDPENQNIDVSDTMLSGPRTAITKISCEHVLDIIVREWQLLASFCAQFTSPDCEDLSRRTWTACSWIISASQLVHQYISLIKDRTFQGFRTKTRYDVGYGLIESWSALPVCIVQKYFIDVSNSSRHKDQLARQIQ